MLLRELEDEVGEGPAIDILSSPVGGAAPSGAFLRDFSRTQDRRGPVPPGRMLRPVSVGVAIESRVGIHSRRAG